MRLALEVTPLVHPPFSGIARCTSQMVAALSAQAEAPHIDLYSECPWNGADGQDDLLRLPRVRHIAPRSRVPRRAGRYDVVLSSFNRLIPGALGTHAMWVHDFYLHLGISNHDEVNRRRLLAEMQQVYDACQHLICISQSTRRDALRFLDVPEQNIHVVPHGIDDRFAPVADAECQRIREAFGLRRPFLFFVGLLYENKNLSRLVAAYARSTLSADFDLAIAGPMPATDPAARRLDHLLRQTGTRGRIHLLGRVPERDLVPLYCASSALAFPSLYEGFGMPILEAMRCGTPVLTSNVSACPEVAGGHAELVDPYSLDELAQGLDRVVRRTGAQREAARAYAQGFTWARSAAAMRGALDQIAGSAPSGLRQP